MLMNGTASWDELGGAPWDAVFCRNLLIYFDAADQARAVDVLRRLLAPEGILFVGPSEAGLLLGRGFESAGLAHAFAFRPEAFTQLRLVRWDPMHRPVVERPAWRIRILDDQCQLPSTLGQA